MMLPPKAGRHLVVPGLIAAALIGAGVMAMLTTRGMLAKGYVELGQAKSAREQAQTRLARATDEEREIRDSLVDYRKLLGRGVIGEEQRLEWIDQITEIKTRRKLFDVKYSIEPQRPVDYPGLTARGEVEFRASPLKLDMMLLHEEDLLRFIADLRSTLSAYVSVRACSIDRTDRAALDRGLAPRLRASCDIDLVTIRDRQAKRSIGAAS